MVALLYWVVDTRRHQCRITTVCSMYPLDCDAGPMNGDNNIIQLPKDKGL
jgi:hypothetical protein